jgi:hypothetical protein
MLELSFDRTCLHHLHYSLAKLESRFYSSLMSSRYYPRDGTRAASRELRSTTGLIDGDGDLDVGRPRAPIGVADLQRTISGMDECDGETRSRSAAGADAKEAQSRPRPTATIVSGLKQGQPRKVVRQAAAGKGRGPIYLDWPSKEPARTSVKQDSSHRRVTADETTGLRQHLDVPEPASNAPDKSTNGRSPGEGLSAFLGRLLDQLSLSAWLPAAMLVGSLSVLLQLHAQRNRDVAEAATKLVNKPLGLLVVLLFAIVLATMVTQAFEFEVIRLLEGYWGNSLAARGILRLSVYRQQRKFYRLLRERDELTLRAFREARLVENGIVPASKGYIVDLIEGDLANGGTEARGWREKRRAREAQKYKEKWRQFAPANLMSRLEAVESRIYEYPQPYRILPTKLGNVIRAVEDSISTTRGGGLESFVIRQWDEIPSGLRKEHDQYRGRLDLYCTLMFVFLILAIISPPLITLGPRYLTDTIATSIAYLFLSFVSYSAAIASARGYATALKAIAEMNDADKVRHRSRT